MLPVSIRTLMTGLALGVCAGAAHADMVTDWNGAWRDTVRAVGGGPTATSRTAAMMNTAMFDALVAIEGGYYPYHFRPAVTPAAGTSRDAAIATAAHRVLSHEYPGRAALFSQVYTQQLAAIPDGPGKAAAIDLGEAAAADIIALRAHDNADNNAPYLAGAGPGQWRPTDGPAVVGCNWWNVTPWVINNVSPFRPPPAPAMSTPEYAAALNEVKSLGARFSTTRTAEQTDIARFWSNDTLGTYLPPGHLNNALAEICVQQGLSMSQNARIFALISLGMADGCVVAWDAKFHMGNDLWRPVTAVRLADTDGNPATEADPAWLPLLEATPPFPGYISGHATFGAAHATVLSRFFGTDNLTFTISSEDPRYTGAPRVYHSFNAAALENANSRVYLGVHFIFDVIQGNVTGNAVANYIYDHALTPVCAADADASGEVNANDVSIYLNGWYGDIVNGATAFDSDRSGETDANDISTFINTWYIAVTNGGHC